MITGKAGNLRLWLKAADWPLLLFLLVFFNVKLVVKLAALVFIYALRFNTKHGFALRNTRLPLFYPAVILIALINWLICGLFTSSHYNAALFTGIAFWLCCILACHQVKLAAERNPPVVLHRTVLLFLLINASLSLLQYTYHAVSAGEVNLYQYQGEYQKYFISTGDYITGISFDTSTTNAVICAMGVLYCLSRRHYAAALLCMVVLLLTGSNLLNLLLTGILLLLFLFRSSRNQKSIIAICLLLMLVFLLKVSPQNNRYLAETWQRIADPGHPLPSLWILKKDTPLVLKPDSVLTAAELRQKKAQLYIDSLNRSLAAVHKPAEAAPAVPVTPQGKIELPRPDIHSEPFQYRQSATPLKAQLQQLAASKPAVFTLAGKKGEVSKWPGKVLAAQQTLAYFAAHPARLLTGSGMANFSSKLAFRVSALSIAGGYPRRMAYIHPDFQRNHLDLYLHYFAGYDGKHSVINSPNSVYGQLLSEYGLLGIAAFLLLYAWYFARHSRILSYGLPLLLLMGGVFAIDYWYEQLSVTVLFELLLFLNIHENTQQPADE